MTQQETTTAPSITDAIAAAGGTCGPVAARGEQECTLNGVTFQLAADGFSGQAEARKAACDGGYVNADYKILTDGHWTIGTDHNADLETIRAALAGQGIAAEIRPYCS